LTSSQTAPLAHEDDAVELDRLLALALDAVRAGARLGLDPGEELRIDTKRNRNDVSYIKRTGVQYEHTAHSGLWDKLTLNYNRQNIQMSTMTWDLPNDFAQQGMNAQVYYSLRRIVQRTQQIDARAEKSIDLGRWKWNVNYGLGWSKATNENDNYTRWVRAYNTRVTTSALNAAFCGLAATSAVSAAGRGPERTGSHSSSMICAAQGGRSNRFRSSASSFQGPWSSAPGRSWSREAPTHPECTQPPARDVRL